MIILKVLCFIVWIKARGHHSLGFTMNSHDIAISWSNDLEADECMDAQVVLVLMGLSSSQATGRWKGSKPINLLFNLKPIKSNCPLKRIICHAS
jgi:hypothetical protein